MEIATNASPLYLDALVESGNYRTREREIVYDVRGAPTAELSLVPALQVARSLGHLRERPARCASLSLVERGNLLSLAAEAFQQQHLGGLHLDTYQRLASRTTGLPLNVVKEATGIVTAACHAAVTNVERARTCGALMDWRNTRRGTGVIHWRRRGRLLAILASGNHPAVHSLWVEALALGYRIVVRPSRRDPFTAQRLVLALRTAGFADEDVLFFPCSHAVADELVRHSDLAMVFGGDAVISRYTNGWPGTPVLPQGPGRVKVIIDGPWQPHLDVVVRSVAGLGGASCLNATGILVSQDAEGFARALAERLAALTPFRPDDASAELPCRPLAEARELAKFLESRARGANPILGGDGQIHDLGDGSAALRPSVVLLKDALAEQLSAELPFPCAWVAPWSPSDGVRPLRGSLVVGVATMNEALFEAIVDEPSIHNVYALDRPTWWLESGIPHDGYLSEFLMRCVAIVR